VVRLELLHPFRTSSSYKRHLDHIVLKIHADGLASWGECATPSDPYYNGETTETALAILRNFLIPAFVSGQWASVDELNEILAKTKGNRFARAGLEMAAWDLKGHAEGLSLADMLGGTRKSVMSGVSIGIESDLPTLVEMVGTFVDQGYKRIKLKVAPGYDIDPIRAVRSVFPQINLVVDANGAYTRAHIGDLRRLDEFALLAIEQPLEADDLIGHAQLQSLIETPVCLDESIRSLIELETALRLRSCRMVNIKVSRLGGLREAKQVHDMCKAHNIPVCCGGMHEFGIGRAANVAISTLEGFSIPGDVSGSDKYYERDVLKVPIKAVQGVIASLSAPGLGVEVDEEWLEKRTLHKETIRL
jgi:O-succinylbenzoate synthase